MTQQARGFDCREHRFGSASTRGSPGPVAAGRAVGSEILHRCVGGLGQQDGRRHPDTVARRQANATQGQCNSGPMQLRANATQGQCNSGPMQLRANATQGQCNSGPMQLRANAIRAMQPGPMQLRGQCNSRANATQGHRNPGSNATPRPRVQLRAPTAAGAAPQSPRPRAAS